MSSLPPTAPESAALLARWLDGSADATARDAAWQQAQAGLEPEVLEAVLALRPELAPAPEIDLEGILDEISEGPLAPVSAEEAAAAAALADWLDTGDGQPPVDALGDDILDREVVESLAALRPERAPMPSLDMDDILGSLAAGPLAAAAPVAPAGVAPPTTPVAPAPPAGGGGAEVVELAARRPRMPRWVLPGAGIIAMAATTLLFVGPMADKAMEGPAQATAPSHLDAVESPEPAAPPSLSRALAPPAERERQAASSAGRAGSGPASTPSPKAKPSVAPLSEPEPEPEIALEEGAATSADRDSRAQAGQSAGRAASSAPAADDKLTDQLESLGYLRSEAEPDAAPTGGDFRWGEPGPTATSAPEGAAAASAKSAVGSRADASTGADRWEAPVARNAVDEPVEAEQERKPAEPPPPPTKPAKTTTKSVERSAAEAPADTFGVIGGAEDQAPVQAADLADSDDVSVDGTADGTDRRNASGEAASAAGWDAEAPPADEQEELEDTEEEQALEEVKAKKKESAEAREVETLSAAGGASPAGRDYSESRSKDRRSALRPRRPSSAPAAASPPPPPPPQSAPVPTTLRAAHPELAATWARADQALARGDLAAHRAALKPLLSHADSNVAVDAAVRLATAAMDHGQLGQARLDLDAVMLRTPGPIQRARYSVTRRTLDSMVAPVQLDAAEPTITNTTEYE